MENSEKKRSIFSYTGSALNCILVHKINIVIFRESQFSVVGRPCSEPANDACSIISRRILRQLGSESSSEADASRRPLWSVNFTETFYKCDFDCDFILVSAAVFGTSICIRNESACGFNFALSSNSSVTSASAVGILVWQPAASVFKPAAAAAVIDDKYGSQSERQWTDVM